MRNFLSKANFNKNKDLFLGHGTFFILFIFSIIFANERVLFMDSAYQLFEMIRTSEFHQNVNRYSMYLAELLPLFAIHLKLPLNVVVLLYSLSFTLMAYGFWLLTTYVLKNKYVGIIMLFIMIGIRQTFFHTISETFQLMFFGAFLYAWLTSRFAEKKEIAWKILYYFVALLMMALCVFIHPAALFFLLFIAGVYILNKNYTIKQKIVISLLTTGILILKYFTIEPGSHDTDYNMGVQDFFGHCLNLHQLVSTKWFLNHLIDFYWAPCLLLILASIRYVRKKQWMNFSFFVGYFFFFMIITLVVYHKGDSTLGWERSFLPLMFFCGLPFMRDVFPNMSVKLNKIFFIVLTCLIIGGYIKIAIASAPHTERLKKIDEIVAFANKENQKKLVMDKKVASTIIPRYNWATGFESMMYSAMIHIDSTVSFYIQKDLNTAKEDPDFLNEAVYFGVPWWKFWRISSLNPNYFKLPKQQAKELTIEDGKFVIKDL